MTSYAASCGIQKARKSKVLWTILFVVLGLLALSAVVFAAMLVLALVEAAGGGEDRTGYSFYDDDDLLDEHHHIRPLLGVVAPKKEK